MSELRLGWGLLGLLLLVAQSPLALPAIVASAVPWALGGLVLLRDRGGHVATVATTVLAERGPRLSLLFLAVVLGLCGIVIGPLGGLIASAWIGAFLLLGAGRGASALRDLLTGFALTATTVAILGTLTEAVLAIPSLGDRLGTPAARARWDTHYDSLWTRNVFGLRSPHEQVARGPGVRRIVALGDSYTWGDKIGESDSTWPAQLERILGGENVEVWNLGERGFTAANEAERLRRFGWQLEPDVIVVQWFANDALGSTAHFGREGEAWQPLLPSRFRRQPIGSSATMYLLERTFNQLLRLREAGAGYGALYDEGAPGWAQLKAAYREIGDSARARGVPVLLVLYPAFVPGSWDATTYPLRDIHGKVTSTASAAGLDVLDLVPDFARQSRDWRRWWALPWDQHPNAQANRVAAEAIAARLRQRVFATPPQVLP